MEIIITQEGQHLKKKHGPIADVFTDWWNDQPNEVKFALSPRRLDESIGFYEAGGTLSEMLKHGNISRRLERGFQLE